MSSDESEDGVDFDNYSSSGMTGNLSYYTVLDDDERFQRKRIKREDPWHRGPVWEAGLGALRKLMGATEVRSRWVAGLYNNSAYSDVTIRCQEEVFHCHQLILFQSTVFERMLTAPMRERRTKEIRISDVSPTALAFFLKYLYGKDWDDQPNYRDLLGLIHCADKYDVVTLKWFCLEAMPALLRDENAGELTLAACRYSDSKPLQEYFRTYCQERHSTLIKNPSYRELFRSNVDFFV